MVAVLCRAAAAQGEGQFLTGGKPHTATSIGL